MRTLPVTNQAVTFSNSFRAADAEGEKKKQTAVTTPSRPSESSVKAGPIVTSVLALAALVTSGVALSRGKGAKEGVSQEVETKIKDEIAAAVKNFEERLSKLDDSPEKSDLLEKIKDLKEMLQGKSDWNHYNGHEERLNRLSDAISGLEARVNGISTGFDPGFYREGVDINGRIFSLASVPPSKRTGAAKPAFGEEMVRRLRTEAARRIFGVRKGLDSIPEGGTIRIPTAEYTGIAKTGGLAIVPKEIAENLSKIVAGRQDIRVIVDMPLYRGLVENKLTKEVHRKTYNKLVESDKEGFYDYVQEVYDRTAGEATSKLKDRKTLIKGLRKINTLDLKIYTDKGIENEKVDMLMGETELKVSLDEFMKKIPELKDKMAEAFSKVRTEFTPLEKETLERNLKKDSASYEALKKGEFGKINQNDIIMIENPKTVQEREDAEVLKRMLEKQEFNYKNLIIRKNMFGTDASVKVQTVLYDNGYHGKFDLDVARDAGTDIYNNNPLSNEETERFMYFCKYFYEGMINDKTYKTLRPDAILGNDWHTGGISALVRQLTQVRRAYAEGGMTPEKAEHIQNLPIVTIMHNAGISGNNWTMQEKLLNVLFDHHATEIVKNSYMPNVYIEGKNNGLPMHLWNGLMDGTDVNPQMMAEAYSDIIAPVSEGYGLEMALNNTLGGARREVMELRARVGKYADEGLLKQIALQNGITEEEFAKSSATMIGIPNGCDRANNTLTKAKAVQLAKQLGVPEGTFKPYEPGMDYLEWNNYNARGAIGVVIRDTDKARLSGGKDNPMNIIMPESTDLTGVTENTPRFVMAGRMVDQKGTDIFGKAILEFYKNFKGTDYPVFYVQGPVEVKSMQFVQNIIDAKIELAKTNPEAAKRIVIAGLFSEPGRYDCSKLLASFFPMPSWYEPCGLVHKEGGQFSGAGSVCNRTGGLLTDLQENVNVIVSEFSPEKSDIHTNAKNFADALQRAVDLFNDKEKYRKTIESMMTTNFDWVRKDGPLYKYIEAFQKLGLFSEEIATYKPAA